MLMRVAPSCLPQVMFYGSSLSGRILGAQLPQYYQVLTAPVTKVRAPQPQTGPRSVGFYPPKAPRCFSLSFCCPRC